MTSTTVTSTEFQAKLSIIPRLFIAIPQPQAQATGETDGSQPASY